MEKNWVDDYREDMVKKSAEAFSKDDLIEAGIIQPETTTPIKITEKLESVKLDEIPFLDPDGWSLGGENLLNQVKVFDGKVEMIVDGLVCRNSLNMWYASDGIGKSVLAMQTALEQAHNLPVFGHLECHGRQNIVYIVGERHQNEPLQRIKVMNEKHDFDFKNFHITGKFQGYNLANEKNHAICLGILTDIANYQFGGKIDHVYFDPLNALCTGDMKEDTVVASIRMFISLVMNKFDCAVTFTHHENRGQRNKKGEREGQDYYGNKFLSTMSTSIMHIKTNQAGTIWVKEKDSYQSIYSPIPLIFDSEFMLSEVDQAHTPVTKTVRLKQFINHKFIMRETFSKQDLINHSREVGLDVTDSLLKKIIQNLITDKKIENISKVGVNAKYKILGKVDL